MSAKIDLLIMLYLYKYNKLVNVNFILNLCFINHQIIIMIIIMIKIQLKDIAFYKFIIQTGTYK
jgi:hypothetical protein